MHNRNSRIAGLAPGQQPADGAAAG